MAATAAITAVMAVTTATITSIAAILRIATSQVNGTNQRVMERTTMRHIITTATAHSRIVATEDIIATEGMAAAMDTGAMAVVTLVVDVGGKWLTTKLFL